MLCHEVRGMLALGLMLPNPANEECLGIPGAGPESFRVRDRHGGCRAWRWWPRVRGNRLWNVTKLLRAGLWGVWLCPIL